MIPVAALLAVSATSTATAQGIDYPIRAIREGREGTTHIAFTVGTDGRARDCVVTKSSGSVDLDAASCRMHVERRSFEPVKDEAGNAVEGRFATQVNWKIPD
jgi:periplasmic protein TonB